VLDEKGYLDPVVRKCNIDFGESFFYHENLYLKILMHQLVHLSLVIIENSSYFMGKYMFTEMLGPVLDVYLKHYEQDFTIYNHLPGQNTWDVLTFDYRNMEAPYIDKGIIEFSLMGDTQYKGRHCRDMSPRPMDYLEGHLSQVVISAAAATCFME
jgi:hypothetical protein